MKSSSKDHQRPNREVLDKGQRSKVRIDIIPARVRTGPNPHNDKTLTISLNLLRVPQIENRGNHEDAEDEEQ